MQQNTRHPLFLVLGIIQGIAFIAFFIAMAQPSKPYTGKTNKDYADEKRNEIAEWAFKGGKRP